MRSFVLGVLAASLTLAAEKPNILLIVADDLGYAELSCQGSRDLPTPFIDSIADNGIRFTSGYVSAPVCCPSRAGLMTGRYQTRFGHERNAIGVQNLDEHVGLPLAETTLAERLQREGYRTALVGKWHLGAHATRHPLSRGFDEFFGFLNEGRYYVPQPYLGVATWLRIARNPETPGGPPLRRGRLYFSDQMGNNMDEPTYDKANPVMRGRRRIIEREYLTDALAREAVDFVGRDDDQPFFLYLAFNAPHSPLQAKDRTMQRFAHIEDVQRRIFVSMVADMDDAVGRVLAKLDELGEEKETLIFFLSDNGGPTRELTSSNAPLRDGKGRVYEGGLRVPFLVQWTGKLPAGKIDRRPVIALDVFPTAVRASGGTLEKGLDGVDLLPYLNGDNRGNPHETLYWRYGSRIALRHNDWKMTGRFDTATGAGRDFELFALDSDLGETQDVSAKNPGVVEELRGMWESYNRHMIAPLWGADPRSRPSRDNVPLELLDLRQ